MSDNSKPYAWIKKIPGAVAQADTIPLLGDPPPFPWGELAQELQKLLDISNLELVPSEYVWMEEGTTTKGLGAPLSIQEFAIASLNGSFYLAIPESDMKKLLDLLLFKGKKLAPIDDQFEKAFNDFITLEILNTVQQIGYAPQLMPKLVKNSSLPDSTMLCMDITVTASNFKSVARLFISPELNQSLKEHYAEKNADASFQHPLAEQIDVTLHLEAGRTSLSQQQWKEVKPGDFILLDRCSINPGKNTGTVTMTLKGHPVLRGKLEDGNIKILENPLFREDN